KMWQQMSSATPPALVSSYEEGVRRVLAGNYAFLMESTMLDHRVQRDCNLTQIGGLLDSKGYGIATWKGSPWRDRISLAILELQEKGVIQILYDKWWKNTGDVCNRDGKDSKANPLGVQNIVLDVPGGVFVTLLCGLVLAIVVAILEFCWNTKKNATQGRQSLCSEMGQELRTAMRGGSSRTVLRPGCSRCSPGTHVPPAPGRYEVSICMIESSASPSYHRVVLDNCSSAGHSSLGPQLPLGDVDFTMKFILKSSSPEDAPVSERNVGRGYIAEDRFGVEYTD
ncbi:jg24006, partial [Pararge aegeria aegeria]